MSLQEDALSEEKKGPPSTGPDATHNATREPVEPMPPGEARTLEPGLVLELRPEEDGSNLASQLIGALDRATGGAPGGLAPQERLEAARQELREAVEAGEIDAPSAEAALAHGLEAVERTLGQRGKAARQAGKSGIQRELQLLQELQKLEAAGHVTMEEIMEAQRAEDEGREPNLQTLLARAQRAQREAQERQEEREAWAADHPELAAQEEELEAQRYLHGAIPGLGRADAEGDLADPEPRAAKRLELELNLLGRLSEEEREKLQPYLEEIEEKGLEAVLQETLTPTERANLERAFATAGPLERAMERRRLSVTDPPSSRFGDEGGEDEALEPLFVSLQEGHEGEEADPRVEIALIADDEGEIIEAGVAVDGVQVASAISPLEKGPLEALAALLRAVLDGAHRMPRIGAPTARDRCNDLGGALEPEADYLQHGAHLLELVAAGEGDCTEDGDEIIAEAVASWLKARAGIRASSRASKGADALGRYRLVSKVETLIREGLAVGLLFPAEAEALLKGEAISSASSQTAGEELEPVGCTRTVGGLIVDAMETLRLVTAEEARVLRLREPVAGRSSPDYSPQRGADWHKAHLEAHAAMAPSFQESARTVADPELARRVESVQGATGALRGDVRRLERLLLEGRAEAAQAERAEREKLTHALIEGGSFLEESLERAGEERREMVGALVSGQKERIAKLESATPTPREAMAAEVAALRTKDRLGEQILTLYATLREAAGLLGVQAGKEGLEEAVLEAVRDLRERFSEAQASLILRSPEPAERVTIGAGAQGRAILEALEADEPGLGPVKVAEQRMSQLRQIRGVLARTVEALGVNLEEEEREIDPVALAQGLMSAKESYREELERHHGILERVLTTLGADLKANPIIDALEVAREVAQKLEAAYQAQLEHPETPNLWAAEEDLRKALNLPGAYKGAQLMREAERRIFLLSSAQEEREAILEKLRPILVRFADDLHGVERLDRLLERLGSWLDENIEPIGAAAHPRLSALLAELSGRPFATFRDTEEVLAEVMARVLDAKATLKTRSDRILELGQEIAQLEARSREAQELLAASLFGASAQDEDGDLRRFDLKEAAEAVTGELAEIRLLMIEAARKSSSSAEEAAKLSTLEIARLMVGRYKELRDVCRELELEEADLKELQEALRWKSPEPWDGLLSIVRDRMSLLDRYHAQTLPDLARRRSIAMEALEAVAKGDNLGAMDRAKAAEVLLSRVDDAIGSAARLGGWSRDALEAQLEPAAPTAIGEPAEAAPPIEPASPEAMGWLRVSPQPTQPGGRTTHLWDWHGLGQPLDGLLARLQRDRELAPDHWIAAAALDHEGAVRFFRVPPAATVKEGGEE